MVLTQDDDLASEEFQIGQLQLHMGDDRYMPLPTDHDLETWPNDVLPVFESTEELAHWVETQIPGFFGGMIHVDRISQRDNGGLAKVCIRSLRFRDSARRRSYIAYDYAFLRTPDNGMQWKVVQSRPDSNTSDDSNREVDTDVRKRKRTDNIVRRSDFSGIRSFASMSQAIDILAAELRLNEDDLHVSIRHLTGPTGGRTTYRLQNERAHSQKRTFCLFEADDSRSSSSSQINPSRLPPANMHDNSFWNQRVVHVVNSMDDLQGWIENEILGQVVSVERSSLSDGGGMARWKLTTSHIDPDGNVTHLATNILMRSG